MFSFLFEKQLVESKNSTDTYKNSFDVLLVGEFYINYGLQLILNI